MLQLRAFKVTYIRASAPVIPYSVEDTLQLCVCVCVFLSINLRKEEGAILKAARELVPR